MQLRLDCRKILPRFTLEAYVTLEGPGITALVGPSGAGKTTLLRLIAGLERPDAGTIHFQDALWADYQLDVFLEPWKRPVGMLFQDFALFPHLTLLENVLFATGDRPYAESLMRSMNIWELRDKRPGTVSGGETQRCAVCQALARKPELLLLDEPFSALDPPTRRAVGEQLARRADELGIMMVLVTHTIEEAFHLSSRVLTLVGGRFATGWIEETVTQMERDAQDCRSLLSRMQSDRRIHQ
ncbi:ATP-binding cassette domain-containing protein [Fundidesulfovibrio agrisoli]|uniref:ATP-binding cassette domain-containing protein n=1 Tax=Fundidesulfovibrio agrisoli TaxID=2922717 RepID=UPI001FAC0204|nr:ATP-binding cassette domain-containing protein [Fundidesulfovibrio agrisoli]